MSALREALKDEELLRGEKQAFIGAALRSKTVVAATEQSCISIETWLKALLDFHVIDLYHIYNVLVLAEN